MNTIPIKGFSCYKCSTRFLETHKKDENSKSMGKLEITCFHMHRLNTDISA